MTMLGVSMKKGVLAFNQFNWGISKVDVFGIVLNVGLDIFDSIQRGVSSKGIMLGAALTAAKSVGLIYLDKVIIYNYIWRNCNRKLFWSRRSCSRICCWRSYCFCSKYNFWRNIR